MQQQAPRVGWRSSRQLVPKEFCCSALAYGSSTGIHSEVQIDDTLLENQLRGKATDFRPFWPELGIQENLRE